MLRETPENSLGFRAEFLKSASWASLVRYPTSRRPRAQGELHFPAAAGHTMFSRAPLGLRQPAPWAL